MAVVTIALAIFTLGAQRSGAPSTSARPLAPEQAAAIAAPVMTPEPPQPPEPAKPAVIPPMPPPASTPTVASSEPAAGQFGPLTQDALARFAIWQANTSRERYFIQLLATDAGSAAEVENFLLQTSRQLNLEELRVYRSSLSGRDRIGVIFGDYPNRQAASTAIRNLPDVIRLAQPYPRQVSKLQQ